MKTTRTRTWFELGCTKNEYCTVRFTGMGDFKSHNAAVAYYRSMPRSGSDVGVRVFQVTDVGWGHKEIVRTLDGTVVRCGRADLKNTVPRSHFYAWGTARVLP